MAHIEEVTIGQFVSDILSLYEKIKESKCYFDSMLVITRGGLVAAGYLSQFLDIRLIDTICLKYYNEENEISSELEVIKECNYDLFRSKKVLVVDELQDSGRSLLFIKNELQTRNIFHKIAILYQKTSSSQIADFFVKEVSPECWLDFAWERIAKDFK